MSKLRLVVVGAVFGAALAAGALLLKHALASTGDAGRLSDQAAQEPFR